MLPDQVKKTGYFNSSSGAWVHVSGSPGAATVDYVWDEALGVYRRSQNGTPHVDADELEIRPVNVVVAEVGSINTGMIDTAGSSVGEQQFIGSGRGWVFTDGQVIEVTCEHSHNLSCV